MKCMVCSSKLSRLDIQSEQWSFYHCNNCGLWTSKTADGECPLVTYEGLPDFEVDYSPIYDDLVLSAKHIICLLYTSPSPRDGLLSRMPSSA